ncbi:hypothetical protein [Deinococcus sp.]|uniref:hypothetical protein n=1 Tax=Deinococcus sp. TaxID=47478 RepID=UPI003CC62E93
MMLHRSTIKLLSDLISPKALERILADAARERHTTLSALDLPTLQEILKQDVYKRLQLNVPAGLAKRRVQSVLDSLEQELDAPAQPLSHQTQIATLDQQARQYALYFDWPETQRLRSVLGVARQATSEGRDPEPLLREAAELLEALERRLSEALVLQGQDLSELKAGLGRVSAVGGPKVRRLEALVKQIDEAQDARTLLPAEVERALALHLALRKQVESSVIQNLRTPLSELTQSALGESEEAQPFEVSFDLSALPQDAQERLRTLDREHEARALADLGREHAALLRQEPAQQQAFLELRERAEAGQVLGAEAIQELRARLSEAASGLAQVQGEHLATLVSRLEHLEARDPATHEAVQTARQRLLVMQGTLQAGLLEASELDELDTLVQALEQGGAGTRERLMEVQRETYELERLGRDVPGALADLAPLLGQARTELAAGQLPDLDPLWKLLERRMGEAAQQREAMDARADTVLRDYDQYRSLAGETIQKLGRLVDVLRAQRRLGALSNDARERYLRTLESAEALCGEAAAEFQAAREVTSAFGADALQGLLGVFDTGFDLDLTGAGQGALDGPAPVPLTFTAAQPASGARAGVSRVWVVRQGQVVEGDLSAAAPWQSVQDCQAQVLGVASLWSQAAALHPLRLSLDLPGQAWLVQPQADGQAVVVACGPDLVSAERAAQRWPAG